MSRLNYINAKYSTHLEFLDLSLELRNDSLLVFQSRVKVLYFKILPERANRNRLENRFYLNDF